MKHIWIFSLAVLLAGCGAVCTPKPLAHSTLGTEEQARFEGVWAGADGKGPVFAMAFGCGGVAHLAGLDWRKDDFQLQRFELTIVHGKQQAVDKGGYLSVRLVSEGVSIRDPDEKPWPGYMLVRYKFVSNTDLLLWAPNMNLFAKAIKAGRLQGKTSKDEVELTGPQQALLDFLDDPANADLFDYQNPVLLHKVNSKEERGPLNACDKK